MYLSTWSYASFARPYFYRAGQGGAKMVFYGAEQPVFLTWHGEAPSLTEIMKYKPGDFGKPS